MLFEGRRAAAIVDCSTSCGIKLREAKAFIDEYETLLRKSSPELFAPARVKKGEFWYEDGNNKLQGPVTREELLNLIIEGTLTLNSQVWDNYWNEAWVILGIPRGASWVVLEDPRGAYGGPWREDL